MRQRVSAGVRTMGRRLARGLLALAPAVLPACYSYVPVDSAPEPGLGVQVVLNDVGRVDLAKAVGPGVASIIGILASRSDTDFVVHVIQVNGEYGGVQKWEGEPVVIRPEYVESMGIRRFSVGRTAVAAVAASAGLLAIGQMEGAGAGGGAPSPQKSGSGSSK